MPEGKLQTGSWDVATPHVVDFTVLPEHIDHMGHVNNAVYLAFMEEAAWSHTQAMGLTWQDYQALDTGCVVHRHELDYLAPAHLGEQLRVGTWISSNDHRLTMWRGHQIRRAADGMTLLRAHTRFVCVRLSSGRPCRMPQAFIDVYQPVQDQS